MCFVASGLRCLPKCASAPSLLPSAACLAPGSRRPEARSASERRKHRRKAKERSTLNTAAQGLALLDPADEGSARPQPVEFGTVTARSEVLGTGPCVDGLCTASIVEAQNSQLRLVQGEAEDLSRHFEGSGAEEQRSRPCTSCSTAEVPLHLSWPL